MPRRKTGKKKSNLASSSQKCNNSHPNQSNVDPSTLHTVFRCARDIWREEETSKSKKSLQMETRKFLEFFGCSPIVTASLWSLLVRKNLVPQGGTITKLLWTLLFLKVYSATETLCQTVRVKSPNTFRKHVWGFIESIAMLENDLVSSFFSLFE